MLWTAANAAVECGIDPKTFARRMHELGLDVPRGRAAHKPWLTTKQVMGIVVGDLERERIRDTAASADARELENAQTRGELVLMSEVDKIYRDRLGPMREAIVAIPATYAARCNPGDPHHAHAVLSDMTDQLLKIGRGEP
jgi:phage terminase Nu1 subunit (DNA packaging protein)